MLDGPLLDGFLLGCILLAWGAQAVVPWRLADCLADRLADRAPERRQRLRPWAAALLPLLAAGALAAFAHANRHPDAALAQALYPVSASRLGMLLAVLLAALALVDLVAAGGARSFEPAAWRLAAGFGLTFLLAASLAGELLRIGEGPESALIPLAILAGLRLLVSLAAAETLAPPGHRPVFAPFAGGVLPLYVLLLPARLARALWGGPAAFTLGAAAVLFLAARWLPVSLRRLALGAATLLAGLLLAQAGLLSQRLGVLR